jgi:hypothetical protein
VAVSVFMALLVSEIDPALAGCSSGIVPPVGSSGEKTFQTYEKTNPGNGEVYSGRTSGTGTPEENVAARDANHHMTEQGFGPAKLDKSSSNPDAIRGREQFLIQKNGGAQSQGLVMLSMA